MLIPLPTKPILTSGQIERLSNILDNAGQVILGVAVFSPIVGGFDNVNMGVVVLGLIGVLFCWMISISLARKKEVYTYDV